jgi:ankyrin repeat protein
MQLNFTTCPDSMTTGRVSSQLPAALALHRVCSGGSASAVASLLAHGYDVNERDNAGISPIYYAAGRENLPILRMLPEKGANVNMKGEDYYTPLQTAVQAGHERTVKLLLNHNANVNVQGGKLSWSLIAASVQGHEGIVILLLKIGADINVQGGHYGTALEAASWSGKMEIVKPLLENGADVNAQGGQFGTALNAACYKDYKDDDKKHIVQLLLDNGADINAQGEQFSVLQTASENGLREVVELFIIGVRISKRDGRAKPLCIVRHLDIGLTGMSSSCSSQRVLIAIRDTKVGQPCE